MATASFIKIAMQVLLYVLLINFASAGRIPTGSSQEDLTMLFQYHNGALLTGNVSINLVWYGKFEQSQKTIIFDFIKSLSSAESQAPPSVASWWKIIEKYYNLTQFNNFKLPNLSLGSQIIDNYSLGKTLNMEQIESLAADIGDQVNAINVILTSSDVAVDGFCYSKCGHHGSNEVPYIWVGNSETQCLGFCGWPFKQPVYGPQTLPLFAPNNDVGLDAMVVQLASLSAGTVTNPFGDGYYQGPAGAPLEASSACPGIFAKGAYPGYAGDLLIDASTGASYNANGVNGRKYLLPAIYDPSPKSCSTLV